MCGIAGLIYYGDENKRLGSTLLSLIQPLESRGPDSCGVALYSHPTTAAIKILLHGTHETPWQEVKQWFEQYAPIISWEPLIDGQRLSLNTADQNFDLRQFKQELHLLFPTVHVVSVGQSIEIYKEIGSVEALEQKYNLANFAGSHGIGHTRMATESVVDVHHCHPFTSSYDLSIVHNGQISNYYKLRYQLERTGVVFETNNDSEAIAHYIHYQLLQGKPLEAALERILEIVDGTYTFLVATSDKVGLVRDKYAAKPAVIYETKEMVAIASEYRALLELPNFDPSANIREPGAAEVNTWSTTAPVGVGVENLQAMTL